MKKERLTLVPVGGIANRMRTIASAYQLCADANVDLRIIWFRDRALNAPFNKIFNFAYDNIFVKEATMIDHLVNDRPRLKNLFFPRIGQFLTFDSTIYEKEIEQLRQMNFDFGEWVKDKRCYMASYNEFGQLDDEIYRKLFIPVEIVRQKVEKYVSMFSTNTIGIHIRRTDNVRAIQMSPVELFMEKAEEEFSNNNNTKIFLATDDEYVKKTFKSRFADKIITSMNLADRNSIIGIQDGLAELYTLARTSKIYGSAWSSFSEIAAKIGNIELEIILKNHSNHS